MSREVRRVPKDWDHPKRDDGRFIPLYDDDFETVARAWLAAAVAWDSATDANTVELKQESPFYWQWEGDPPDPDSYRPQWSDEERTHYQMYETTSEGTPISPVMESPEALARWLADTGASSFGRMTATYEQWLNVCQGGWAPSMVAAGGRLMSGVEFLSDGSTNV